jgi:hypothetical protein
MVVGFGQGLNMKVVEHGIGVPVANEGNGFGLTLANEQCGGTT